MRLSMISAVFAATLALSACGAPGISAPAGPGAGSPPPPSGSTALSATAQKALYVAEAAYNVPANAYVTLDGTGKLPPDVKAKAKPALQAAYQALLAARHAATLGDSAGVLAAAATVQAQAKAASAVLPAT